MLNAISREKEISLAFKGMNLKDVVFILNESWNNVPQKAFQSSWKKLWPSKENGYEEWESEDDIPLAEL